MPIAPSLIQISAISGQLLVEMGVRPVPPMLLLWRNITCAGLPTLGGRREERKQNTLKRKIAALETQKPGRLTGVNMFIRDAMAQAAAASGGRDRMPPEVRLAIVSRSAREYAALDSVQKHNYSHRAAIEAQSRHEAIQDSRVALQHQVKLRKMRSADDMDAFDLRFSSACFTDGELRRLGDLAKSDDFSGKRLQALRDVAMLPPSLPPAPIRMHVSAQVVCGPAPLRTARPKWLAPMCAHREAFKDTGLIFQVPSGERYFYCFVFAVQSPYMVCLAPMTLQEPAFEALQIDDQNFEQVASDFARFTFKVRLADFVLDAQFPFGDEYTVFLVRGLRRLAGGCIVSGCEEVPLYDFIADLPTKVVECLLTLAMVCIFYE